MLARKSPRFSSLSRNNKWGKILLAKILVFYNLVVFSLLRLKKPLTSRNRARKIYFKRNFEKCLLLFTKNPRPQKVASIGHRKESKDPWKCRVKSLNQNRKESTIAWCDDELTFEILSTGEGGKSRGNRWSQTRRLYRDNQRQRHKRHDIAGSQQRPWTGCAERREIGSHQVSVDVFNRLLN